MLVCPCVYIAGDRNALSCGRSDDALVPLPEKIAIVRHGLCTVEDVLSRHHAHRLLHSVPEERHYGMEEGKHYDEPVFHLAI